MSDNVGTDLYRRMLAFDDYGRFPERKDLMREVWSPTPWMVDAFTGSTGDRRERDILDWCFERLGEQCMPLHGRVGLWQRGSATVHGWTWFGFTLERDLQEFVAAWPTPADQVRPSA